MIKKASWHIIALSLPVLFFLLWILGASSYELTVCFCGWLVLWWIIEYIPMGITALLPLVILSLAGLENIKNVASSYSKPILFLFLGGFVIGRALEKTELNKRIALLVLKKVGSSATGILVGFCFVTACLSMFVSNTATTVLMLPIVGSVLGFLLVQKNTPSVEVSKFSTPLYLAIAYSANIGGTLTPIGTPPTVVFLGYLEELYQIQIGFGQWMAITAPAGILFLVFMIFFLQWLFPFNINIPKSFKEYLQKQYKNLGKITPRQTYTLVVFITAALLWIFKGFILKLLPGLQLRDEIVALGAAVLLFLPILKQDKKVISGVLDQSDIGKLPWNIFLLFGGGMALAQQMSGAGIIKQIANQAQAFDGTSAFWIMVFCAVAVLLLTEVMSNVALVVVALPILLKMGEEMGLSPALIALPATICASLAFCLPISTPPNAIVFASGAIKPNQMLKAGIVLNAIGLLLTVSLSYWLATLILG